jgi:hypothetical protein
LGRSTYPNAQRRGDVDASVDPARLLYGLFALAVWSQVAPQIVSLLTGGEDDDEAQRTALRTMAQRLVRAAPAA